MALFLLLGGLDECVELLNLIDVKLSEKMSYNLKLLYDCLLLDGLIPFLRVITFANVAK